MATAVAGLRRVRMMGRYPGGVLVAFGSGPASRLAARRLARRAIRLSRPDSNAPASEPSTNRSERTIAVMSFARSSASAASTACWSRKRRPSPDSSQARQSNPTVTQPPFATAARNASPAGPSSNQPRLWTPSFSGGSTQWPKSGSAASRTGSTSASTFSRAAGPVSSLLLSLMSWNYDRPGSDARLRRHQQGGDHRHDRRDDAPDGPVDEAPAEPAGVDRPLYVGEPMERQLRRDEPRRPHDAGHRQQDDATANPRDGRERRDPAVSLADHRQSVEEDEQDAGNGEPDVAQVDRAGRSTFGLVAPGEACQRQPDGHHQGIPDQHRGACDMQREMPGEWPERRRGADERDVERRGVPADEPAAGPEAEGDRCHLR